MGDMTSWHTGLFSDLEGWTSAEQRKQVCSVHLCIQMYIQTTIQAYSFVVRI